MKKKNEKIKLPSSGPDFPGRMFFGGIFSVSVSVLELDGDLLEGALGQQVPLDAAQRLVGVVVGLLHQAQLLALERSRPPAGL